MITKNKRELIRLGREVFPSKNEWTLEELKAQGLPLYWNKQWLEESLHKIGGSTYLLARRYGYPWGEVKRIAQHFGLAFSSPQPFVGKYFILQNDLLEEIDALKPPKQSRSEWIIEALEEFYHGNQDR